MATTGHESEAINVQGLKASLKKGGNKGIYNEAICSTASATAAKVTNTTPPSFTLVNGAKIVVKFTYAINVANATLQVGSTAAKPIYFRGAALPSGAVKAGTSLLLSYDGTSYNIIGGLGEQLDEGDGIDITNGVISVDDSIARVSEVNSKVATAKSEVIGDAASDYNTLGKLEDKIQAEATARENADTALDGRVDDLEAAVGTGGSVDSRIAAAKAEIVGNATSACDTLGEAEALINDRYTKSETYTKTEVNGLVDTPHQNYVTVATYASLPATGSADTIYRVSNYNGSTSQVDVTSYSEYAWNGSSYTFLCVKSQIGEVFDISVYNNNAKYADLAAALNGGANIPQSLQKGGMSVKFVQSSDNKYVQFRLMSDSFNTTLSNWQGIDAEPTAGSRNLVESNGVDNAISTITANSGAEKAKFTPYILNCYIVPTTAEKYNYLKTLADKTIMLYYMAVRNNNLGSNNVFGLMLKIGDSNYGTYYIDEVPNLLQGNIVELSKKWTTAGELANGFRVFVEFNQQIDFSTATSLISSSSVFINPINRCQISYLFEIIRLQSQVSAAVSELADKDAVPTEFSDKLVKSGGVFNAVHKLYSITSLSHFDKAKAVFGYVNHETGNIHYTENYKTSDYIAVSNGIEYRIFNSSNLQVAIYDNSLSFIKGYINANSFNSGGLNQIPANGAYIRFSMAVADLDNAALYVSSEYTARHNWESTTAFKEEVVADAVKGTIINRAATIQNSAGTAGLINVLATIIDTENYHYTIYLEEGTYNLTYEQIMALPDVGFGKIGILLPDNVDLIGLGSGAIINCDLTGKGSAQQQYISPLNIKFNNKLKNLTVTVNNGRYAVHADNSNGVQDVKWEIIDCKFVHYGNSDGNWAYPAAWGEGGCSGMNAHFNNCTFISPRVAYPAHNNVDYEKPSYHKMENCKFISSDKTLAVQLASLGSGVKDIFEFIGCQFDGLFDSRASSTTPNVQSSDFEVIGYGNSPVCENWYYTDGVNYHSNFSDEVIPFINRTENAIPSGTFMKYDNDELKPMVDGDNTIQFVGICLDNVPVGGTGYVKVRGTYRVTAPAEVVWATLGTRIKVGTYNSFAVADNMNIVGKMYYKNTAYTRYYVLLQ